uniref:Uncharacterized protein n=1 Tax=Oryzias latipes TaxID=8090 RepID=A0A3P9KDS1_ORYLA
MKSVSGRRKIPSHDQPLWDVIYNSQFKQLVSLSLDACIRVWDFLTGEFLLEFSALSNVFMKPVAIMFDPTNRKLLVLSKDKEIAYWNFNNGKEIEVLPLKVPNHVTGIENQGTIFDREPLIEDLHDPESLALSTGYKSMGGVVSTSLKTRTTNRKTDILLVSHGGFVFAWSIQRHGGVIAKFRAVTKDSAKITCMTTSKTEKILLTGDSTGRLCLWDIQGFTDRTQSESVQHKALEECVLVCPDSDNIISAGQDHNVKIWTMQGDFLGTFMKDTWDLSLSMFPESKVRKELKNGETMFWGHSTTTVGDLTAVTLFAETGQSPMWRIPLKKTLELQ